MSDDTTAQEQPALFDSFVAATEDDWRREAERSLKGTPLEKLGRRQPEGFALEPIYFPGNAPAHVSGSLPGCSPYVRGASADPGWSVCPAVTAADAAAWNRRAHAELEGGANGLVLRVDAAGVAGLDPDHEAAAGLVGRGGLSLANAEELGRALEGIDLSRVELVVEAGAHTAVLAGLLAATAGDGIAGLRGSLGCDPLGALGVAGKLPAGAAEMLDEAAELVRWCTARAPHLVPMTCHGERYHEAGATAVHELAYTVATGAEYLRALVQRGVEPDIAARSVELSFAVGSRLLMEMAKLRAARILWDSVCAAFGCSPAVRGARIHAHTSAWGQTVCDPWVNMLRATVQTFAAVVGGARRVTVRPFDAAIGAADDFSRRLARNTQVVLRDEAFLDRVVDPGGGSWALEALTDRVGRESWALVQEIERRGGMLATLLEGYPQGELRRVSDERRRAVARRKEPLVGVSIFPDPEEKPRQVAVTDWDRLEQERVAAVRQARPAAAAELDRVSEERGIPALAAAATAGVTLGQLAAALHLGAQPCETTGLHPWRASEAFEALRDAADNHRTSTGELPRATLVCWGEAARLRPRVEWVSGALRAGGFRVEGGTVQPDAEQAAEAVSLGTAGVVVACAADADYPAGIETLRRVQGTAGALAVAGTPPGGEPEWARGLFFLHRGADLVSVLKELHDALEVAR